MAGGSDRRTDHPIPPVPASRRHCWVTGSPDAPGPHPGLVLAWQQRPTGWHALVTYMIEADDALVQQWLSADLLTPIG